MAIEHMGQRSGPYLEVTKTCYKGVEFVWWVSGMRQQTNYLVEFALNFDNNTFQDGNGKLDYDEFLKMLLQY